ncbi:MAG: hypothetical protein WCD18_04860 [Thermosynechococcaceae cyanobacterium]
MSSRRYQSRLFQTLQSQAQQWQDQLQLRWRQFKVATAWGAQIALYPFYLMFQAGRWSGRVFKPTATQGARRLVAALGIDPIAETDQPIQNVLGALELQPLPVATEVCGSGNSHDWQVVLRPIPQPPKSWPARLGRILHQWRCQLQRVLPLAPTSPWALAAAPTFTLPRPMLFRGVASTLASRTLVLTTPDNQSLDILTLDQQRRLHQRIVWEIADALRSQRLFQPDRQLPSWQTWQTRPIPIRPQWSLPVRVIHGLMAWVQQQPIAQLSLLPANHPIHTPSLPRPHLVSPLQRVPSFPIARRIGQIVRQMRQSQLVLKPRPTVALAPIADAVLPPLPSKKTFDLNSLFRQTWDAIRRTVHIKLVGQSHSALVGQPKTIVAAVPVQSHPSLPHRIGQRLQTYRGLLVAGIGAIALMPFTLALPDPAQAATAPALPLPAPVSLPAEWIIDPARVRRRWLEDNDLTEPSEQKTQGKIRIASEKIPAVSATHAAIDVEANVLGYEQHPLEQVLGALDKAMAWVEPQLHRLWQYGQQQWPLIWQQGRDTLAALINWCKTEGIPFCQRWWPVIWKILQTLLIALVAVLRVLGTSLWQWGWPVLQKAGQSIFVAATTWWEQQGTPLWQRGVAGVQNWVRQGWASLWP